MSGSVRLRHRLDEARRRYGGPIGHDIRASPRIRGLATRMLALAHDEARAPGRSRVLLTIDGSNAASIRVAGKNGAYPIGRAERRGLPRFRIDLRPARAAPRSGS